MVSRVARFFEFCVLLAVCCMLSAQVHAAVPHLVRYQGQASDANGVPLEGPYTLTFRLYNAETLGTVVWQETQSNVSLTKGNFSVLLGQVTPLNVDWATPLWLSIQVGTGSELSPRQRITSVPLAIRAETAESLVGGPTDISARVYNSAAISFASGADTPLTFGSERWDTDNIHSTTVNTNRLTATTAGKYLIAGHVQFANNSTGFRFIYIRLNGSTTIAATTSGSSPVNNMYLSIAVHYNLAATDYVELLAFQNSGVALDINATANLSPEFGMVKVQ